MRKLEDVRASKAEEHATKVRKLFEEHPECAREAIIIWPQGQVTLAPEHLSTFSILGMLEAAKFGVCVQSMKELEDE